MGDGPVVLVVDDDAGLRGALRRLLERKGVATVAAASLAGAREQLVAYRRTIEVVIVDLGLGAEEGLDLVREVRRSSARPSILVFSAEADGAAGAQAAALGADEILVKPACPEAILAAVRRILGPAHAEPTGEWLRTHPASGKQRTP